MSNRPSILMAKKFEKRDRKVLNDFKAPPKIETPESETALGEKLSVARRTLYRPSRADEDEQSLMKLKKKIGLRTLNYSQVTRALWWLLKEGAIDVALDPEGMEFKSPQPSDTDALDRLDQELAAYLYHYINELHPVSEEK
ncbi:MAG: hypothetical protein QNJ54_18560 [Prochloraceae cyanobacterium]|nr:hypothetical protein [Prochloraceae cyanobacterium]